MVIHRTHKSRRNEVAVALAIYGNDLSPRDRKIARAYAQGKQAALIAHMHDVSVPNVYVIINKLRNRLI